MARTKKNLEKLLKLLAKQPITREKIHSTLKADRKTIYRNIIEAQKRGWIEKDSLSRYHLTALGKANIGTAKHPIDTASLEAHSQVIDFLKLRPERPTAKCTIEIEGAKKIKELDSKTDAIKRFLTHDGLWLPENNTNLKAAVAAVVDSILDLKAKQMNLSTILDEQFRDQLTHLLPPGYDTMKRYQQLAKTKFNVLIEFNGLEWVKKQSFGDLEKMVEDNPWTRSKHFSENVSTMDQTVRLNNAIYQLWASGGSNDLSSTTLQANNLFGNITGLKEHVYDHFKLFQVSNENNQINDAVEKAFDTGFFSIEKKELYHLKVNREKELGFFNAINAKAAITNDISDKSNEQNQKQKSKKEGGKENTMDTSQGAVENTDHIVSVSKELEDFEKAFCDSLTSLKEKFETSQVQSFNKTVDREYPNLIANALRALLKIFYEMASVYLHRLLVIWPKEVKDKATLHRLCCIVFAKIAEIRSLIEIGLKFVHGGDFEKYFDSYAGGKMYATNNLLKYVKIFKNTSIENHSSKLLLDSMWKIYEQCKQQAYPEPLIYGWNFDYSNDGWEKLVELQMQHPDQTYDNCIDKTEKSYSDSTSYK